MSFNRLQYKDPLIRYVKPSFGQLIYHVNIKLTLFLIKLNFARVSFDQVDLISELNIQIILRQSV